MGDLSVISGPLAAIMARTQAATEAFVEGEAARAGMSVDEMFAAEERERVRDLKIEAVRRSGTTLPAHAVRRMIAGKLRRTESLEAVAQYLRIDEPERPMIILSGSIGSGKTVAATWAIAQRHGGFFVHAPDLHRVTSPTWTERENGARTVNIGSSMIVLDDLGTESDPREARWADAFLTFVDARCGGQKTIITTNLPATELLSRYGDRVADRLQAYASIVECRGVQSMRSKWL